MHHYSKRLDAREFQAYVTARMQAANERMLTGRTADERIRAGRWVAVWSVMAGADPPAGLKLRCRCQTDQLVQKCRT
jgi:hypothetical protein